MADTERENRAQADIHAFLQRRRLELKREYLTRGRRFANLNHEQLTENWIAAVRTWLARKDRVTAGDGRFNSRAAIARIRTAI